MTEPQLSSDNSSTTAFPPLLAGDIKRSRAYSQSYHPEGAGDGVSLRRGSAGRTERGYGTVPYNMGQGKGKELPTLWTIWNISPGRIRKRVFGLAGVLFFGSCILWSLACSYRDSADYKLEAVYEPAPKIVHVNPSAHVERNEYIHLVTLPFNIHSPPTPPVHSKPGRHFRRLIFIGDVHGAYDELKELLDKVKFDSTGGSDHVVFTGDVVAKGPKSSEVLDLLRKLEDRGVGSCVRGNHDDRVLKAYRRLHRDTEGGEDEVDELDEEGEEVDEEGEEVAGDDGALEEIHENIIDIQDEYSEQGKRRRQRKRASDEAVAKTLTLAQAKYLAGCPLILRIPRAGHRGGELLVVHAGIVPGTPLLKQDPKLLMNMRTILPPEGHKHKGGEIQIGKGSSTRKGRHWAGIWNEWEERQIKGKFILGEDEEKTVVTEVLWEGVDEENTIAEDVLWEGVDEDVVIGGDEAVPEVLLKKQEDEEREQGTTVVYGHYAAKGLDLRKWTKGLDSNCVRGGALSALIVESKRGKEKGDKGDVEMEVVSVKCKKYVD